MSIPYGRHKISGFVGGKVGKPSFATKQIDGVISRYHLSSELIELHSWILDFYPYGSGSITKLFIPNTTDFTKLSKKPINPPKKITKTDLPIMTLDQKTTVDTINNSGHQSFLIHGETGSGKTRIYQELARQTLSKKKSVVVLVPEISLINQMLESFYDVSDNTYVIHSNLTKKQHRENWQQLLESTEPSVLIGTRSAIFAPIHNLGLVVIDEMHETSYKQDSLPRYNTIRVAAKRSNINHAKIIYGSATPAISEYFLAKQSNIPIIRLTKKAKSSKKITKTIIDIKNRDNFSANPYISNQIISALESRLKRNEQSLLFLNRRGTAKQILCQNCGWQAMCPKCDLPMTLHADIHKLRCHTCGYSQNPIYSCPKCRNNDITYRSIGTKAIANTIHNLFPEANVKRFDTDNLSADKLSNNYADVKSGKIDIIIGTQMLGKGLDLPKLSLVGIINADISLSMPDFSSVERNYQLIHQAIGRVGRGHVDGEIILQTFHPENKIIKAAIDHDWQSLYEQEIIERKAFHFPPFKFIAKISASRKNSDSAAKFLENLRQNILNINKSLDVSSPMPSFYEKVAGKYNWHILIKTNHRKNLTSVIRQLPSGDYSIDLYPLNLL